VKHPGKTPAQRRVLDEIGCGNYSPNASKKTISALLEQGLIEELSPLRIPFIGSLCMEVRQFQMPIPVHFQWCASCLDEDEADAPTPSPIPTQEKPGS
jgi:hypothetical protein